MINYETILSIDDEQIKKAFGKSLKELREYVDITQVELGKYTSVPRQSISVYERGEILPTISQAYRLATYFHLTVDDLIVYGLKMQKRIFKEDFPSIIDKFSVAENE